jgi:hypothetical protein
MKTDIPIKTTETSSPEGSTSGGRRVVIINHHEARVFRSTDAGTIPEQILSRTAGEHLGHAPNSKDFSRGGEKPDPHVFFPPVARALKDAGEILVFGSGAGTANEMHQLVTWLGLHHADLAKRVIGAVTVDEHHLTDSQLLAKARDFYALPRRPGVATS